jgi:hypothetical protein
MPALSTPAIACIVAAACAAVSWFANRGANRERERRLACERECEQELRGQATATEDGLRALHRQVTRQ